MYIWLEINYPLLAAYFLNGVSQNLLQIVYVIGFTIKVILREEWHRKCCKTNGLATS